MDYSDIDTYVNFKSWIESTRQILNSEITFSTKLFFSINFHYNRFLAHVTKQLSYNGRGMSTHGPSTTPAPCILFIRKHTQKKLNDSSDGLLQEAEEAIILPLSPVQHQWSSVSKPGPLLYTRHWDADTCGYNAG